MEKELHVRMEKGMEKKLGAGMEKGIEKKLVAVMETTSPAADETDSDDLELRFNDVARGVSALDDVTSKDDGDSTDCDDVSFDAD